jgi:hypothetical protein
LERFLGFIRTRLKLVAAGAKADGQQRRSDDGRDSKHGENARSFHLVSHLFCDETRTSSLDLL